MSEWFERWFGEDYLKLYPHRDEEDAQRAIGLVGSRVALDGRRVLDLACGPGRHAVQLVEAGADVVGIDLSVALLDRARKGSPPFTSVVRGDMRALPFREPAFDVVVNLFTSFGYFKTDDEHMNVLTQIGRILVPEGNFMIDYLNADHVCANLVRAEETTVGGKAVSIQREIVENGRFVCKTMRVLDEGSTFVERVRLFGMAELTAMLAAAGLEVWDRLGDYEASVWSPASPRTILFARRS